jgi:hypothetical protein
MYGSITSLIGLLLLLLLLALGENSGTNTTNLPITADTTIRSDSKNKNLYDENERPQSSSYPFSIWIFQVSSLAFFRPVFGGYTHLHRAVIRVSNVIHKLLVV